MNPGAHRDRRATTGGPFFPLNWKRNIVEDPHAPELYSELAVLGFSIFVTPLFGAILLSMNLKRVQNISSIPLVLGFGILWYAFTLYVVPDGASVFQVLLLNAIGGAPLVYVLWPGVLGKGLKYRRRPVLIPIIIAALVYALFILVWFIPGG